MKYYYTYKITLTQGSLKGKFYFGKHSTTKLNDNYKGSGSIVKRYYKKYPKGYIKEINSLLCATASSSESQIALIVPFL